MQRSLPQPAATETFRVLQDRWRDLCSEYLPLAARGSIWRYSRMPAEGSPWQGWKIHISSTVITACEVLSAIGPTLRGAKALFKAPASLDGLMRLNSGISYGYSQVGKSFTVYPNDESEFVGMVRLLAPLVAKWSSGPAVPFDLRYKKTCIYYRYGAFRRNSESRSDPRSFPSIVTPEGTAIVDRRNISPSEIPWIRDPFVCETTSGSDYKTDRFNNRYIVYTALSQRGKGGVYECLDLKYDPPRVCILKEGRKNGEAAWDGRDGRSRIRNESRVLKALEKRNVNVPSVIDQFRLNGNEYLLLEYFDGINLNSFIASDLSSVSSEVLLELCRQISRIVSSIHNAGWLWRDCKPSNFIINMRGDVTAIDFEGACPADRPDPLPWSTPFFSPPELLAVHQNNLVQGDRKHDLYALGVCLFQLLEGKLPKKSGGAGVAKINRRGVPRIAKDVISKLLCDDPVQRPDAKAVADTFEELVA